MRRGIAPDDTRRLLYQGALFPDLEPAQAPDRRATSGVVCLTCGADVATGEAHSAACEALHGPYCPGWDGTHDPETH